METVNYEPVIRSMKWSFSRIKAFRDCPYRWYLKYLHRLKSQNLFFSDYGTFMHKLIELYYSGKMTPEQLCEKYLFEFREQVTDGAPNQKVFTSYFHGGLNYLKNLEPLPYEMIALEKRVNVSINGIPFIGYIDYLGKNEKGLVIVDHKSRMLKPRSGRRKPTRTDEELDRYLVQLYLYAAAVEQEYGQPPVALCFNCFRVPVLIEEPFNAKSYAAAKKWLADSIEEIATAKEFKPNLEYFKCTHVCEMRDQCEYYALFKESN